MRHRLLLLGVGLLMSAAIPVAWADGGGAAPDLNPQPKLERWTGNIAVLAEAEAVVRVSAASGTTGPLAEGVALLRRRIENLSYRAGITSSTAPEIAFQLCDHQAITDRLRETGAGEELEPERMRQTYLLAVRRSEDGHGRVLVAAPHPRGLYYGATTLCQLLETDTGGNLVVPEGEILDYPEIAIRLAKTSASMSAPEDIERFASWLSVSKLSHIGLQYHGRNSRNPEAPFEENVERFCAEYDRKGTLDTVVYFCPFRGEVTGATGAYHFARPDDRKEYADYLLWILAQGADGIEVDYNDWPGSREVPIGDVLNLAYETATADRPDTVLLYCPPNRGEESYRGMATPQLGETLSRVPARVWPLWTGMQTLITEPLTEEQVLEWTRIAGRRPFLWVNRVGPAVPEPFVQKIEGDPTALVFAGDRIPNDLHRLFTGVHLNAGLQRGYNRITGDFDRDALVYLATTADYLWNPHGWKAEESRRRARRFVEIMIPVVMGKGG